ncbi:DNA sulfur modification protein DndB [Nakamurella panacisegetis]|uniref:DNA sulfur modification protein DndB n=1 Tax=Nakamurella panacisegetis TaxID=1090615 RepID=A0A1H0IUZ5_9ACTN|nr:DNA sulfur modification protein DndB [Nakamurella panacisegetis]SDO35060.1 DNA sulfur modification protein DndB [Nakamurella panacisegetis]
MATYVFPAIRGRIGSTDYYQVTMSARELAGVVRPASELEEWTRWTIGERIQRDVAVTRVREELVPYLLRARDRFFGSLIVLAYEPDVFEFEALDLVNATVHAAHRDAAERMGFLTVDGGRLVALDGQHRLVALREIVNGRCEADPSVIASVASDEICVVFIKYDTLEKTRRIFNKVNRHARPTTPSDNIITSEDDGYAIVARWLVDRDPPLGLTKPRPPLNLFDSDGEPLVEWRQTNLPQFTQKLTTLNAVYQTVEAACDAHGLHHFDEKHRVNRPRNDELERAYRWSAGWWTSVLDGLEPYRLAVARPHRIRAMRQYQEKWSLLFRPIAQVALFRGIGESIRLGLDAKLAIERMNRIDWRASSNVWMDVIVRSNGKMIASRQAINLGGRLISYFVAEELMDEDAQEVLRRDYALARGWYPGRVGPMPGLPKLPGRRVGWLLNHPQFAQTCVPSLPTTPSS